MSFEISKTLCITVRNDGEYGAFMLREGQHKTGNQDYYCELTIQSGFGNVGHFWNAMGSPAYQFLASCDKHYLMGKLFGECATVFDYDGTVRAMRKEVCKQRHLGWIDKELARKLWENMDELEHTRDATAFYYQVFGSHLDFTELWEPGELPTVNMLNPQAEGLWEKLWPEFIEGLKQVCEVGVAKSLRPHEQIGKVLLLHDFDALPSGQWYEVRLETKFENDQGEFRNITVKEQK